MLCHLRKRQKVASSKGQSRVNGLNLYLASPFIEAIALSTETMARLSYSSALGLGLRNV
jgi:hypothetical protein